MQRLARIIEAHKESKIENERPTVLCEAFYNNWKLTKMLSALCGAFALIPAIIDYELGYSSLRRTDKCMISSEYQFILRTILVILSFAGLLLQIPCKIYYYRYINTLPLTFDEIPPEHNLCYLHVIELLRKRKFKEYLFNENTWAVVLLFLINPYPDSNIEIFLNQQMLYKQVKICYYLEELFYFLMFFRLFYLVSAFLSYGRFQTTAAKRICAQYYVESSSYYALKCYAKLYPLRILVFMFLIPGIVIFGIGVRIFERPLHIPFQDFEYLGNSMWNIVVTMTTVGYGDTIVTSNLARIVICLSIFWGGIILSLTFVTLGGILRLKNDEIYAYRTISVIRESVKIISEKYIQARMSNKEEETNIALNFFNKVKTKIQFSNLPSQENMLLKESLIVEAKYARIKRTADDIEAKLLQILKWFIKKLLIYSQFHINNNLNDWINSFLE